MLLQDLNYSPDQIIDSKLPFTTYHKFLFLIIGSILLADGSEALSLSLMLPCVIEEYNLDEGNKKLMSTVYYIGVLIGALAGGLIADKYGRKNILLVTTLFTALLGFSAYIIVNITIFMLIRFCFGILIGVVSPLSVSIITESYPSILRGKIFILCRVGKMFGELFSACLGMIFLENNLKKGNWRALLLVSAIPAFISFILSWLYLVEPPRYYLAKLDIDSATNSLKKISLINNKKFIPFSNEEKKFLLQFYQNCKENKTTLELVKALFNDKYKNFTLLIWIMWCCMTFIFYGGTFILPITLSKTSELNNEQGLWSSPFAKILSPILSEIPASIASAYIINTIYFGRKYSLFFSLLVAGVANFLCYVCDPSYLVVLLGIARFFLVLGYNVKYTYTSEVYHTSIRSTGVGCASSCGRMGGIIMPLLLITAVDISPFLPFLELSIVCFLGAIVCYSFPYDTVGRELDS